jgi:hypothetical protein
MIEDPRMNGSMFEARANAMGASRAYLKEVDQFASLANLSGGIHFVGVDKKESSLLSNPQILCVE